MANVGKDKGQVESGGEIDEAGSTKVGRARGETGEE